MMILSKSYLIKTITYSIRSGNIFYLLARFGILGETVCFYNTSNSIRSTVRKRTNRENPDTHGVYSGSYASFPEHKNKSGKTKTDLPPKKHILENSLRRPTVLQYSII